jgi:hypothetical protein
LHTHIEWWLYELVLITRTWICPLFRGEYRGGTITWSL